MKHIKKIINIIALCFIIGFIFSSSCIISTYPNQYTLIKQFGKIIKIVSTPGLSFKLPIIQSKITLPKSIQIYDIDPSEVITKDKKTMVVDCFVLWNVSDPLQYVKTLNGDQHIAESRINTIVFNALKNVISSIPQSQVISGRDGELTQLIMEAIDKSPDEYGINISAVETKSLDLPDDNKESVYQRMISERNNIAASYVAEGNSEATKIRTQTDTEIQVQLSGARAKSDEIIAEGDAEYMRILSDAYSDPDKAEFYNFVRSLDAAKNSLTGNNKTIIIDKSSPIAQIFYNK